MRSRAGRRVRHALPVRGCHARVAALQASRRGCNLCYRILHVAQCRWITGVSWKMLESVVSDYEYRQRVRRYKPSSPVLLIAAAAVRYWQQQDWMNSPYRKYTPWALADAAWVSLACGTEHNRPDATDQGLLQILNAFSRFDDPFLRDNDVHAFLLRMAGQQMTWQVPEYETIARTAAIFDQTPPLRPMECLQPGWDINLCSAARSGSMSEPPSWPGPARSAARGASTRQSSTPRTASSSRGTSAGITVTPAAACPQHRRNKPLTHEAPAL
jgi:hypothetical protein